MEGEVQITNDQERELTECIVNGQFDKAVDVLSRNPETFSSFIRITGNSIVKSKNEAELIRDRNWFKKLFSSNSSDLAKIIIEQNGTISNFFVILQLLTLQTRGNVSLMKNLCESIKRIGNIEGSEQDNISKLATAFLEQNIEAIKGEELRDKALRKLLIAAEMTDQFEFRMTCLVDEIENDNKAFKNTIDTQIAELKANIDNKLAEIDRKFLNDNKAFKNTIDTQIAELKANIDNKLAEIDRKFLQQSEVIKTDITCFEEQLNKMHSQTRNELESEILKLKKDNSSLVSLINEKEIQINERFSSIQKKQKALTVISSIIGIGLLCIIAFELFN